MKRKHSFVRVRPGYPDAHALERACMEMGGERALSKGGMIMARADEEGRARTGANCRWRSGREEGGEADWESLTH